METTRWKLGRHNSVSSLSQEPRVDDKAKDKVFVPSKRKRKEKETHRVRTINYLPREVIFNILLFLPAKLLYEVVRYVCKQWYDIVTEPFFVRAHCQMSTTTTTTSTSFIIQSQVKKNNVYCADQDNVKSVKVTKIELPFPVLIQGSCNGLVVFCDRQDSRKVYLMNPLTKQVVSLPPVVPVVQGELNNISYSFAVNSSGQYKMVQFSHYSDPYSCELGVFTIGVDKAWRRIDVQGLLGIDMISPSTSHYWLLIAGFLYSCNNYSFSLAMDVDTETVYRISWPKGVDKYMFYSYFISLGTTLGLMTEDDKTRSIWKLHKLTDLKSSDWTEIAMIDIGAMVWKIRGYNTTYTSMRIKPVSLIDGELCFYGRSSYVIALVFRYNLANESFVFFGVQASYCIYPHFCIHHIPTLVSPKNC